MLYLLHNHHHWSSLYYHYHWSCLFSSIIIIIIIVKGAPPCSKTPLAITEQIQALATQYNLEFKVLGLVIFRLHPIFSIEIMLLLMIQCQLCFYCISELIDCLIDWLVDGLFWLVWLINLIDLLDWFITIHSSLFTLFFYFHLLYSTI